MDRILIEYITERSSFHLFQIDSDVYISRNFKPHNKKHLLYRTISFY